MIPSIEKSFLEESAGGCEKRYSIGLTIPHIKHLRASSKKIPIFFTAPYIFLQFVANLLKPI